MEGSWVESHISALAHGADSVVPRLEISPFFIDLFHQPSPGKPPGDPPGGTPGDPPTKAPVLSKLAITENPIKQGN